MKAKYMKSDLNRLLKAPKTYVAVLGVTVSLFLSLEKRGMRQSVMDTYFMAVTLSGLALAYTFCALPYALVFCEDLEKNYVRYQAVRGKISHYVTSKVCIIYVSSVITMLMGNLLFVLLCRLQIPWTVKDDANINLLMAGMYGKILGEHHYLAYCFLYSMQLGMLGGTLSTASAALSLFISNKVMVIALPVCLYQLGFEFPDNRYISIFSFSAYNKIFEYDWQGLLFVFFFSIVPVILFGFIMVKRIRKRL